MTTPRTPMNAARALSGRAAIALAAATAVFLLGVHLQSDGFCSADETAVNAFVMAVMVAAVGLTAAALSVLGRGYRGVRLAALAGWAATLLPAYLLMAWAMRYVASVHAGCPQ
ncbi:hypothetical protein [Actinoplanes sichuanensis]|uniref:Uncharacterized protein n=1 Tax=Actinoplanes sichuanensis TaxID=512349 RepID=A0ABW4A3E5_9ACTN|nr:hypothetical protein [Actinoplanes sichuanensis]